MNSPVFIIAFAAAVAIVTALVGWRLRAQTPAPPTTDDPTKIYSYTVKTIDGNDKSLSEYKGQVLLIVNTASKCGYTPQYEQLETLYQEYKGKGLRILAFPANNFGAQEPGTNEEIKEFCRLNYNTTIDLFAKISVKGDDIAPLYKYLTTESPYPGEIKWNFNKFLVDKQGNVIARYGSKVTPFDADLIAKIEGAL